MSKQRVFVPPNIARLMSAEDRKANGFFETMIVDDNVYIGKLATRLGWSFLLSRTRRSKLANYWVEQVMSFWLSIPTKKRSW